MAKERIGIMKQLVVLIGCAVVLLGFVGCQSANKGVEVIIEDGGQFPEFLVGRWKAYGKSGWEFVFKPDGTISSIIHSLGRVRLKPGQVTTVPMKMGGKSVYEPGQWFVYYTPATRELTVKIILKSFYAEVGGGIVEGKSKDIFTGKIDEDGKTWLVDQTSFPDYTAHTDKYPNFRMAEDPNTGITITLTFEKVEK